MHKVFLQQAIDLAVENARSGQGGPYGAIIVKDNQADCRQRQQGHQHY